MTDGAEGRGRERLQRNQIQPRANAYTRSRRRRHARGGTKGVGKRAGPGTSANPSSRPARSIGRARRPEARRRPRDRRPTA